MNLLCFFLRLKRMSLSEPRLDVSDDYLDDSQKYSRVVKKIGSLRGGSSKAN